MSDRDALARLVSAIDGYFASKGLPEDVSQDVRHTVWVRAFNKAMAALSEAKRVLASEEK